MSICLLVVMVCTISVTVFAYSDQNVSFSFDTFNSGNGFVNGSQTGTYYSLRPVNVAMTVSGFSVTSSIDGQPTTGTCIVELLKGSKSYGTQAISSTSSICRWQVDVDSNRYYLYARGQQPCTYKHFSVTGTMHDHGI